MKLFRSHIEEEEETEEVNIWVKIKVDYSETINLRDEMRTYFEGEYFDLNLDEEEDNDDCANPLEAYVNKRMKEITEEEIKDFFTNQYSSPVEMLGELIDDGVIDEEDLDIDVSLDTEDSDEEDDDEVEDDDEPTPERDLGEESEKEGSTLEEVTLKIKERR